MHAYIGSIEIQMTRKQAAACSHPGQCDDDVAELLKVPSIRRQLAKISDGDLQAELREYGTWDTDELQDRAANEARIVWIAANDITEECGR